MTLPEKALADYFQKQGWEIEDQGQQVLAMKYSRGGEDDLIIVCVTDLCVVLREAQREVCK